MLKQLYITTSIIVIPFFSFSQSTYEKAYLETGFIAASNSHVSIADSILYIVGEIRGPGVPPQYQTNFSDLLFMKINNDTIEWLNFYGGYQFDEGLSFTNQNDIFYITGKLITHDTILQGDIVIGLTNAPLIKSNKDGSNIWEKTYSFSQFDIGKGIIILNDTIYLLAISSNYIEYSWGGSDIIEEITLAKIDSSGAILNTYTFYEDDVTNLKLIESSDNNLIILSSKGYSSKIKKISPNGNIIWESSLANNSSKIKETSDKGFIITGANNVTKIDSLGNALWVNSYPSLNNNPNQENGIDIINDSTFIVSGSKDVSNSFLMKTNSNGDIIWYKEFGLNYRNNLNTVSITNSGFISSGYIVKDNSVSVFIVKTDFNGNNRR